MRGSFKKSQQGERKYLVGPVEAGGEVAQHAQDGEDGALPLFRRRVGNVRDTLEQSRIVMDRMKEEVADYIMFKEKMTKLNKLDYVV